MSQGRGTHLSQTVHGQKSQSCIRPLLQQIEQNCMGNNISLASSEMKTIKHTFEEYISTPTAFGPVPDSALDSAMVVVFNSAVVDTMATTFDSVAGTAHCIVTDIEPALFLAFVLHVCCFFKAIFAEGALLRTKEETGGSDPMRYLGTCSPVEVQAVCFV
jgi:hypothetical protein